jgi:hypothetical protein
MSQLRRLCVFLALCILAPPALAQSGAGAGQNVPSFPAMPEHRPLTSGERLHWLVRSTVGLESLGAGVISSSWSTAFNDPEEYGPHWDGFGKRYGIRLTGIATSNAIEAGLGSVWNEDPRYFAADEGGVWERIGHAAKMTVLAVGPDGATGPAYARYAGVTGSSFLSNTWRVESESSNSAALQRIALGFAGRFASNVFSEFWPVLRRKMFGSD